ncbi:MAG TPA: NADH-quinone oxidoreductase subunit J [bacterium]|jgi:NADH:ubiquinone oxidoreductase subunit 6 (subunit J)
MGEFAAFTILALVTLIPAVVVVSSRNIVRSALSLIPTFLGVTGIYIMLGAEFVAGIQVLIYAGAITVLLLFVIMLTEGGSGVRVRQANEQVPLGATAAVWLGFVILLVIFRTPWPLAVGGPPQYNAATIGSAFLTDYVLVFEVTSLAMLVSLVGAIIIARREE